MKTSSFLRWLRAAVVCAAVGLANAAWSDIPASAYVQRGLVAQWDGIENAGAGTHQADATEWVDLKGARNLTLNSGEAFGTNCLLQAKGGSHVTTGWSLTSVTFETVVKRRSGTGNIHRWEVSPWASSFESWSTDSEGILERIGTTRMLTTKPVNGAVYTMVTRYTNKGEHRFQSTVNGVTTKAKSTNGSTTVGNVNIPSTINFVKEGVDTEFYTVRVYDRELSDAEITYNANIDKVRFEGADPSSLTWPEGYAYDAESGKLRWRCTFKAPEGGSVLMNGKALTEDCVLWADNGDVVECVLAATADIDHNFEGWEGDVDAIVSGDRMSPTISVRAKSSITLMPRFASAPKLFVSTEGVDAEGRGTFDAPCRSIGFAVDHAVEGQEIRIAGGLYEESVTNRDDKTGKGAIKFIGSWKGDFSARDLRNCRTIVRPPEAFLKKVPCFMISAYTNRFDGIDMTGGSYGVVDPYGWVFGSIGKTHGGNDNSVIHHEIRHCALTNNTYALGSGWEGFAVASSLIAKNGTGFFQQADHGTVSYFHNCTFADNTNYALYQNATWNAAFSARNCVFIGNGYVLRTTNSGKNFYDSCFGPQVSAYFYDSTKRYSLYGECPFKDPMLDEGYAPREGSPVLQVGKDLSNNASIAVVDDLYGEPWESDGYDLGCIKSEYKKVPVIKYALQYVSMTGNDANEGTTPETARASIQAALDHIAPTGVVRILKGRYTGIANIMDAGVTVEGESRDETVVVSSDKGQFPGLDVKAHNVTIRNLTLENGNAGVYVEQFATADKCMISNCVMRANSCGVTLVGGANDGTSGGHWTHVSHCWITNNTSHGLNAGSTYRMDNCLIARNSGYGVNGTYGDRYSQSIAVNCTVADNTGAYGIFANDSWAGSQTFYDCVLSGHKTGVFRNNVTYSGGVNLYGSVLCNLTNISNTAGASRIVKDAATIEVEDVRLDMSAHRLYWPRFSSPAVGMTRSRNATLAVKVYSDLNSRPLNLRKAYAVGCYQPAVRGMQIIVR